MSDSLVVRGAREHNLKNVGIELPRDKLIVFTGLSGSGKSSLAFDTIYAEGQRRYVESLSSYARQFLGQMDKPDVDFIEGLSPAISIDQKSASRNPRSTVGTITEVYDYLRLLYARIGVPHCPECGAQIIRQTPQQIVDRILELPEGTRFQVLAPVVRGRKGTYETLLADLAAQGFARARIDGEVHELTDKVDLARYEQHTIEVVVDRLVVREGLERRLTDSLETALRLADGVAEVQIVRRDGEARRRRRGRRGRRHAHLLPAPGLPERPRLVRGAGPPQLLVQLALRRLRDVRRPRHPLRGRPRADRPEPRPLARRGRHRARGPAGTASTSSGWSRRWPRSSAPTLDVPWSKLTKKQQQAFLHGTGVGKVQVRYKNRYGRVRSVHRQLRGRRPVPAAPPQRVGERQRRASRSRATCGRCRARRAAAPGSSRCRSASPSTATRSPRSATCRSARRPRRSPASSCPSATASSPSGW